MSLHIFRNLRPGHIQEGRRIVNILNKMFVHRTWFNHTWPFNHKGHFKRFIIHPAFVIPAMVANVEPLIGAIDHNRIICQTLFFKCLHQASDTFVYTFDATQVVFRISLKFPAHQIVTLQVCLMECLVFGIPSIPPDFKLLRGKTF